MYKRQIEEISTAPIFHIEWKHRELYNSKSNTYTPTHAHTHTHTLTHTNTHTNTHTCTRTHTHAHHSRTTETKTAVEKTDRLEIVLEKVGFKSGFD